MKEELKGEIDKFIITVEYLNTSLSLTEHNKMSKEVET